jgi:RHS repeat-associated protein
MGNDPREWVAVRTSGWWCEEPGLWDTPLRCVSLRPPATPSTEEETTIASHRVFDSFGVLISETSSAIAILIGFTGRPLDESTGLQNNWNRWYDAESGRWPSEDPIGFGGQDPNLARYVGNSPVQYVDPSGLVNEDFYTTKDFVWAAAGGFWNQLFSWDSLSTAVGSAPLAGSAQSGVELVTGI